MSEETRTIIEAKDYYGNECLQDSFQQLNNNGRGPRGFVEIFERDKAGNEKYMGKQNLVVYNARELIAQKIINRNNPNTVTDLNEFLCWFGIGRGGANPGDPFNPSPPLNSDVNLYDDVPISPTDTTCADFHDGFFYKAPIDDISFEVDPFNEGAWLVLRTTTILGLDRALGEEVNEAGLFTALSDSSGYTGPFHLFARITFPTIVKTNNRELIFVWYIYT